MGWIGLSTLKRAWWLSWVMAISQTLSYDMFYGVIGWFSLGRAMLWSMCNKELLLIDRGLQPILSRQKLYWNCCLKSKEPTFSQFVPFWIQVFMEENERWNFESIKSDSKSLAGKMGWDNKNIACLPPSQKVFVRLKWQNNIDSYHLYWMLHIYQTLCWPVYKSYWTVTSTISNRLSFCSHCVRKLRFREEK